MTSLDDAYEEFKGFMSALSGPDRMSFVGVALGVLSCFLPWKETAAEGEVLGLMSLGVISLIAMLATGTALVLRVRGTLPAQTMYMAQLGSMAISSIWCLIYAKTAWIDTMVRAQEGNYELPVSKPAAGVLICLLASLMALGGTLLGLKERQS